MPAQIIDGNALAAAKLAKLKTERQKLTAPPHLAAIRANNDAGSKWYAQAQAKHCAANGVQYTLAELGETAAEAAIIAKIAEFNRDDNISAILLHLPLPPHCDYLKLLQQIAPYKDAEGVQPLNLGKLLAVGKTTPAPCTAMSAVALVASVAPDLRGKKAVVIGRSAIVGKPAALLLLNLNATVTIAHSYSNLTAVCREADVIIAATGAAGIIWNRYAQALALAKKENTPRPAIPDLSPLVKKDMVKEGAIVIDVGVSQIPRALDEHGEPTKNAKGRDDLIYVGDVDVENVKTVAAYITNPQGGVGPVTNAFLLENVYALATAQMMNDELRRG